MMLAQVRRFFESHGDSRFAYWKNGDDSRQAKTINRAGWRRMNDEGDEGGHVFYVLPETFRIEVCAGFDSRAVCHALATVGALRSEGKGGFTRKERIPAESGEGGKGSVRVYVIHGWKLFAGDDSEGDGPQTA